MLFIEIKLLGIELLLLGTQSFSRYHGRVATVMRLARLLEDIDTACKLWNACEKDLEHLFHSCLFTQTFRNNVCQWLGFCIACQSLKQLYTLMEAQKGMRARLLYTTYASLQYHIWSKRNQRTFERINHSAASVTEAVKVDFKNCKIVYEF